MLKPGGCIAYYNIFVTEGLPEDARRQAGKVRPGTYTPAQQRGLLRSAGFTRIRETDVTAEFERVQRALYEAARRHERALRRTQGDERFEQRQADRRESLRGLAEGVLRRSLFVARRP
ncbi:MAG: hypothetical protein WD939_01350 [Dehalococcoidia bacterium]